MPYAKWLEDTLKELYNLYPVSISMQMIGADGNAYTCYSNVTPNDRAIMIDAMQEDGVFDMIRSNKDLVNEILNGEEEE